jgi:hypothetical protein
MPLRIFVNKLASEIGRDAIKVINDINTKSSEHNTPRSSQGLTRVKEYPRQLDTPMICIILYKSLDTHKKNKKNRFILNWIFFYFFS